MSDRLDQRPIGVFDSGVGGLTVLSELHRRLPRESTLYLGDNGRAPYGPRPAEEVQRFTLEAVDWLLGAARPVIDALGRDRAPSDKSPRSVTVTE